MGLACPYDVGGWWEDGIFPGSIGLVSNTIAERSMMIAIRYRGGVTSMF